MTRGMRRGGGERSMVRGSMLLSQALALQEGEREGGRELFEGSLWRGDRWERGGREGHCEPASAVIHEFMSSSRA